MALRSTLTRLGIAAAGGALITLATTTPALADDDWESDGSPESYSNSQDWNNNNQDSNNDGRDWNNGRDWDHQNNHNPRLYKGRVTARGGLTLRDAPTRGSAVIGSAPYGSIVHIFCKTSGQRVEGNNLWYLLTDGTWAWGAAYYIDNIGPAPRWC
ncbi:SH3 domain-containing protein [Streptomyces sp. NPDC058371]|uniref:SH3 domain-containing protein n=1 Tax=Streptomyces sp. NPDC058371 TaxID=3346463 RepID=UPI0036514411